MNKYALYIDEYACWGCKACEVACKQENRQPFGINYIRVNEAWSKRGPGKLDFTFSLKVCRHCDSPPCEMACPENALTKDRETGIVLYREDRCNGCGAVPGQSGAEKQETSPCKIGCPAHNNVQGYVNLAAKGKFKEALQLINETSPFPSICGRVCYHPCESDCNRSQIDQSVASRSIERFLGDLDRSSGDRYLPPIKARKEEKVAIVGSGPAGLACAYYLAREGYPVTVFEKEPVLGGMLVLGIPPYRLPRDIVEAEVRHLRSMGVALKTGIEVGRDTTLDRLRREGFRAFLIAIGTQECKRLGIEGETLKGIYGGLDYLRRIHLGEPLSLGKQVAVIGGGNTALDAARSARRLGSEHVFILYRRGLEEMPSRPEEMEACREEGIPIRFLTQPVRFLGETGRVKAIECVTMRLTEPDESGRRRPEPLAGSEFTIPVDAVITALGQEADWACLTPDCACTISSWGTLEVHPLTLQSRDLDIFAGGDAIRGPRTVIEAIADGRQAAISMDRYLQGQDLSSGRDLKLHPIPKPQTEKYDPSPRIQMPHLEPRERIHHFGEIQKGLTQEMVLQEARRCISCGTCCIQACPFDAIRFNGGKNITLKCDLCHHRVEHGLYPACADNVCLAHCIHFGRAEEIEKLAAEIGEKRLGSRLDQI